MQTRDVRSRPGQEYQPSASEIRAMCLMIQDEWSARERRARELGANLRDIDQIGQWTVHEVRWTPDAHWALPE